MKVMTDIYLKDFEFWSDAVDTVRHLNDEDFATIEAVLEDIYPDGMEDTDINDIFRFEEDMLADWLGYDDWETLIEEREADND